jgi:ATP-binding cassette subfamily B protein
MFNIKELLGLSDEGYLGFKRGVAATTVANLVMLIPFGVIILVIDTLLAPLMHGGAIGTERLWLLFACALAAAALYFFAYRNEYRKTYTVAYSEAEKIRVEVAERMRRLPLSFFNSKDLTELTTNIMADCTSIEHTMSHVVPGLFADSITCALACALLALYDWRMALALFIALPVALGLIILMRRLSAKLGERHVTAKLEVAEQMQEYLEGVKVVKAFGLSGEKSEALEHSLRTMMKQAIKFEGFAGIFVTLAMTILQVGIGLVTLVGVTLFTGGGIGAETFLVFLVVSARIYAPLIVVLTLLPEFFYLLVSTRRMQALRREPVMGGDENVTLPDCTIELRNIAFAYNDDEVIKQVSLSVPQGGVTALVGPSGSGKTTIARLLARLWEVREGAITIGG